jgi:broad specificity phosphatase PhoE
MRRLILVRHSLPQIRPDAPARSWPLCDEGRRRCTPLARRLADYAPTAIMASVEPKAVETAQIVAATLGLPYETQEGLHEHERNNAGFLEADAFEHAVRGLFARPDDLVFGRETARQAQDRFTLAIQHVHARHREGTVAVVAHGTVMALFVARHAGVEPFALWQKLGAPSFVVLELPDYTLVTTVTTIAGS